MYSGSSSTARPTSPAARCSAGRTTAPRGTDSAEDLVTDGAMTVFVLKCASYEGSSRICAFGNCPFRMCRAAAFSVVQHLGGLLQESRRGASGGRRVRDSRTQARSRLAAGGHAKLVGESALREHEGGGAFSIARAPDMACGGSSIAREAAAEAQKTPEADMPGFVLRSRGRCEYRP